MQTVNFQCGHCGNLMAVSVENLGQQVRCPTCQQVVIAPAATRAEPPATAFGELERSEDIFHTPTETSDALFEAPEPLPLDLTPPSAPEPPPLPPTPTPTPHDNGVSSLPWSPPDNPEPVTASPQIEPPVRRPAEGRAVGMFLPLVLLPLVLYAVAATSVAAYLFVNWQPPQKSMFEQMPDIEGDTPGVRKDKKPVQLKITREIALKPLPEHLRVKLGDTITIGDLSVTPKRVERRKVVVERENAPDRPDPSPYDALLLTLSLKNTSADYSFSPLDNFFDRATKPGDEIVPLTVLTAGNEAFFGGPAQWYPSKAKTGRRQWITGRGNFDKNGLAPGESAEKVIATDGWDEKTASRLFGVDADGKRSGEPYRGKLLWRVQLRRGLVNWRGKEVPATAVIGVEFDDAAYSKAS